MNKIEEKRQREISIVTKMIEVYCRKKHVVVIAHLWKQKHFVQTAVFTAINQK